MSMVGLGVENLLRLVRAGGAVTVTPALGANNLIQIATAGRSSGSKLVVTGATALSIDNLLRIASASPGNVHFE